MAKTEPDETQEEARDVYRRLREDLVAGAFPPGGKLMPLRLRQRYAASPSSVREALLRLAAEGFVRSSPQRGFRAVAPTPESVWEIVCFRLLIETEGARLSILHGDMAWEANLTAAHHRLSHLESRMRGEALTPARLKLWSGCDRTFHEALIAACGSALLKSHHLLIFDRYKQHVIAQDPTLGYRGRELVREHRDILASALDRDAAACADALRRHFEAQRPFSEAGME